MIKINSFMTKVPIIKKTSIDMQSKSMDWFLYNRDLRYERVKLRLYKLFQEINYS